MQVVFTIGHTDSYLQGLKENGKDFKKLGRREPSVGYPNGYAGGIVFLSEAEAVQYINTSIHEVSDRPKEEFGVFGLVLPTSVEVDTYMTDEGYRGLIPDARIIEYETCEWCKGSGDYFNEEYGCCQCGEPYKEHRESSGHSPVPRMEPCEKCDGYGLIFHD